MFTGQSVAGRVLKFWNISCTTNTLGLKLRSEHNNSSELSWYSFTIIQANCCESVSLPAMSRHVFRTKHPPIQHSTNNLRILHRWKVAFLFNITGVLWIWQFNDIFFKREIMPFGHRLVTREPTSPNIFLVQASINQYNLQITYK